MYLISDLDKTLVYSRQGEYTCVEYKGDKPITYMTPKAKDTMDRLLQNDDFHLIPCTLRSIEQTMRIGFIRDNIPEFMICDNGASIYKNGEVDIDWDIAIDKIINKKEVAILYKKVQEYIKINNIPIYMLKTNRDAFISVIFNDKDTSEKYIDNILQFVNKSCYNIFKQGKKTYIVPKLLNKEIAVRFLREHYHVHNVITSGDSSVDDKFVELGDYQVLPQHAIFRLPKAIVTENSGIVGGEELLGIVEKIENNQKAIS